MRKKLIFALVAILLFSAWPAYAYNSDTAPQESVRTKVSQSAAPTLKYHTTGSSSRSITLKNPTFEEVKDFILKDPTSRNEFVFNQYECRHFATEVNNNADTAGLRCAFVLLCFHRGQHAVIAFDTVDRGLVYIEPQTDATIRPEVDGNYQGKEIKQILIAW